MLRIVSVPFLFRNSTPKYLPESYNVSHHYGIAILDVIDSDTIIATEINDDFLSLTHQNKNSLINCNLNDNPIWNDNGELWRAICLSLTDKKTQAIRWNLKNGKVNNVLNCSIVPILGPEGKISTLTLILSNDSAEIAFADQIKRFNYYDTLTGLPNQNYLNEIIESELAEKHPYGEIAVLMINIQKFQRLNESYGYEHGDIIIQKLAQRINFILPENAILIRFDGDKFTIVLSDNTVGKIQREAEALAASLHHNLLTPITIQKKEIHLSISIGIAVGGCSPAESHYHIQHAHIAMQRLKTTSSNKTLVYQPELQVRANSRLILEDDLRKALKKSALTVNYQPIISLQNGSLIGFEALCRWNHPKNGMISPIEFIPLAEETGLILPLGNFILREACKNLKIWTDKYQNISHLVMNINVSGLQLLQDDFVSIIQEAMLKSGITGQQLKLEITETTLIENAEIARDKLLDLKALGVALAIDDFGTGYSSLSYLNLFPIDTLKIDKSFVNKMSATKDSYKIVHIISTLAQTLGMNLVAEGIEEQDQMMALKKLGCQAGQGFLFSKPLSFENAEEYIRKELTSLV
ncbi:MAG: bifunctional diguanylate cyclase/phosphodiesterase [Emcibacter sp.]|nr:bifunctional diguanylate cyclase/phosphodiesterase [Emcibacter sp.]